MRPVAVHAAIHFHQQHHNVIAANMQAARQRQNHMLVLRADLQVMKLSADLLSALSVTSSAEHLMFSVQGLHIREKRKHEAQAIIAAIPRALEELNYCGLRDAEKQIHTAVGHHGLGGYLLVGIKFIPASRARSKRDEAWVTTAYFLGSSELRRLLRREKLNPIHRTLPQLERDVP